MLPVSHLLNAGVILALVWTMGSCAPKSSQSVLSFFFDGVKDSVPQSAETVGDTNVTESALLQKEKEISQKEPEMNYHKPYFNQECEKCHDKANKSMTRVPLTDLCFECHDSFQKKYAKVHGPVAGGYCISCHAPHISKIPHLLKQNPGDLCLNCHTKDELSGIKGHGTLTGAACLQCHLPHGSNREHLLKD